MAGSQQYKDVEILFILKAILLGLSFRWIVDMFEKRFGRRLTDNQLRYIKNKYGRDPRFGYASWPALPPNITLALAICSYC